MDPHPSPDDDVASRVEYLRSRYLDEVVGWMPSRAPIGAVIDPSDAMVRVHYSTHGTIEACGELSDDLQWQVSSAKGRFGKRREPVEWRVVEPGPDGMSQALHDAGFTTGWHRTALVADVEDLPKLGGIGADGGVAGDVRVRRLDEIFSAADPDWLIAAARQAEPHRRTFAEAWADGRPSWWEAPVFVAERGEGLIAGMWGEFLTGTDFVAVNGFTQVRRDLLAMAREWAIHQRLHFVAIEASGGDVPLLIDAGFHPVAQITSYHWSLAPPAVSSRPVSLVRASEYDLIWSAFYERFHFRPGMTSFPAITEPADSVTWSLEAVAVDDSTVDDLQRWIQTGLIISRQFGGERSIG